ncbi:VanZ family protein [Halopseudomonas salegens]|uniref:VanZ like family protein n=1 Tax=Halopseudomonas salegens TaxID=1434072 RepID=A0A1H2EHY4_9GAMM|nr:VanZ family protein [Halopseudomonas salegens]SDT94684.1 VanZ like family protein [Halopseudomonas salegens]
MYKLIVTIAVVFFAFVLWVIYLANTGGSSVFFDFIRSIPYGDKLGHMCLFGFLTLVTIIGSKFRSFSCGGFELYYGAVLVGLFVVVEELSQAFIPSRTFDFVDLAADAVGIVIAVGIAYVASKHLTNVAT